MLPAFDLQPTPSGGRARRFRVWAGGLVGKDDGLILTGLVLWSVLWWLIFSGSRGYSWHYFVTGATTLTGVDPRCGGLHVYACHPELQFGPLTMVVAAALHGSGVGFSLVSLAMVLVGPGLLAALARVRGDGVGMPVPRGTLLVVGAVVIPFWALLSVYYAHLDDVLALGFAVAAVLAFSRSRHLAATVALAAATAAKPWAVGFAALLLLVPRERRGRHLVVFVGLAALGWLPFLLVDAGTLGLARFSISTSPSSALRAIGVDTAMTPTWDRPAQLVLALVVSVLLVRRWWVLVPLAVVASRLVLDPQVYGYYSSGLLVAAAIADLTVVRGACASPLGRRRRWPAMPALPWWTLLCGSWAYADLAAGYVLDDAAKAQLRLGCMVGLLALLIGASWLRRNPRHRAQPPPDANLGLTQPVGVGRGYHAPE